MLCYGFSPPFSNSENLPMKWLRIRNKNDHSTAYYDFAIFILYSFYNKQSLLIFYLTAFLDRKMIDNVMLPVNIKTSVEHLFISINTSLQILFSLQRLIHHVTQFSRYIEQMYKYCTNEPY